MLFGSFFRYRDVKSFTGAFNTDAQYLDYGDFGKMPDYRVSRFILLKRVIVAVYYSPFTIEQWLTLENS